MVTRDIRKLEVGQVAYTPWCDAAGKVLDDGTIARLGEAEFRMTAAEPNLRWLQDNAMELDVEIEDVSESLAALSLQGPASRGSSATSTSSIRLAAGTWAASRSRYRAPATPATSATRSGCARDALDLWDYLIEAGTPYGIVPAGCSRSTWRASRRG